MPQHPTARRLARTSTARWLALATLLLALWPAVVPAQGATPAAAPSGAMTELFGLVPAQLPGVEEPADLLISYADIATQLDAVGVEAPAGVDDPGFDRWTDATRWLALPGDARAFVKLWREGFGFDLTQVDQAISIDAPPAHLALYRGRFDPEAVLAALTEVGYQPVTVNGQELLSIRDDFAIDPASPTGYRMAQMNFGAVLPDGTLAFASAGAPLAAVLDVAAGTAPSMLELEGVAMLVEQAPPDLVSGTIVHGFHLELGIPPALIDVIGTPDPDLDAVATAAAGEIAAARELPPVAMALLGATAGGPIGEAPLPAGMPAARAVALVQMLDPASAEAAVPIVEGRLEQGASASTGRPYAELFSGWTVEALPGTPLLRVELTLAESTAPSILTQMLTKRDLGFLSW